MKGEGAGHLWLVPAEGEGEGSQPKVKGGVTFAVLQKVKGEGSPWGSFQTKVRGGEGRPPSILGGRGRQMEFAPTVRTRVLEGAGVADMLRTRVLEGFVMANTFRTRVLESFGVAYAL